MRVVINPTQIAFDAHPDESFDVVEVSGKQVKLQEETEIPTALYHTIQSLTFPHPQTGFKTRYFDIDVISTEDAPDPLASAVVNETTLFQAVYVQLKKRLPELTPSDINNGTIAIYTQIKGATCQSQQIH